MRTYGQRCSVARALDVVGERWSLLVVRELTLGPRRYRDLLDGLPGIPTNLLANRLKDLQSAGIITKHTLPPPAAVTVYELTDAGRSLRPVLTELRHWGDRYGTAPSDTDTIRPSWALLSAASHPTALPDGRVCELQVDGEFFQFSATDSRLHVHGGPAQAADSGITMSAEVLLRLMSGHLTAHAAAPQVTITGDPGIAHIILETLHGTVAGST